MSNMNFNGGRGGIQGNKAVSVSEHKFGGSHKANPGGKRGESAVIGSHGGGKVDRLTPGDPAGLRRQERGLLMTQVSGTNPSLYTNTRKPKATPKSKRK